MSRSIYIRSSDFSSQKSALKAQLEKRFRRLQDKIPEPVREVVAKAAEALGTQTFPGPQAIGFTVRSMRQDFSKVYATASRVYRILDGRNESLARSFYAAWKRGDLSVVRSILRDSGTEISGIEVGRSLDPSLREGFRDSNGRVVCPLPVQLVRKEEYEAALQVAIAEIGKTASGWFACAQQLGGDGNAVRWKGVAVHGSAGGTASIEDSSFGSAVVLRNHMPLAKKHLSPGQVARIQEQVREDLRLRLQSLARSA